jgi:hypothetical protein
VTVSVTGTLNAVGRLELDTLPLALVVAPELMVMVPL